MTKIQKSYLYAFVAWVINIKLFLVVSGWEQVSQIFKYSSGVFDFYKQTFIYFYAFIFTIPTFTFILTLIFVTVLYHFWLFYFQVFSHRLPTANVSPTGSTGLWEILSSIFIFLGFGCVACGQTLLLPIIFFFFSSTSLFLVEAVGNLSMILGIIFLIFGTIKNKKMLQNPNICKI